MELPFRFFLIILVKIKPMTKHLHDPSFLRKIALTLIISCFGADVVAQDLYVGPNAEFYVGNELTFTTNNTVVELDDTATFSLESGSSWGSSQEYVNGQVHVLGSGETMLPVGDNGVYAPVTMEHSTDVSAKYSNSPPPSGSNGLDVDAVGTEEFWELTGTAIVTLPWNANSGITDLVNNNGGSLNAVSIVGLNNDTWDLISASHSFTVSGDLLNGEVESDQNNEVDLNGFGAFTFGIDHQIVLSVNDLLLTSGIDLVSNPVRRDDPMIRFKADGAFMEVKASIFDIHGRLLKQYEHVNLSLGEGNLPKSNLKSGLYIVKFEHEGKQGTKKLIIE